MLNLTAQSGYSCLSDCTHPPRLILLPASFLFSLLSLFSRSLPDWSRASHLSTLLLARRRSVLMRLLRLLPSGRRAPALIPGAVQVLSLVLVSAPIVAFSSSVVCFGFFPAAAALVAACHVWSYTVALTHCLARYIKVWPYSFLGRLRLHGAGHACIRDADEIDTRSTIGREAASAPTSLQIMRKTAHASLKSTAYRRHRHLRKTVRGFYFG